jgi:hypothetical protein
MWIPATWDETAHETLENIISWKGSTPWILARFHRHVNKAAVRQMAISDLMVYQVLFKWLLEKSEDALLGVDPQICRGG